MLETPIKHILNNLKHDFTNPVQFFHDFFCQGYSEIL